MSLSYQKRQLMRQAVSFYHDAKKQSRYDWPRVLQSMMVKSGLDVRHPGADKYYVIRGPIVVKWAGKCKWSDTPIQLEMKVYRTLRKLGLAKHIPNVYLYRKDFIVEQNLGEEKNNYIDINDAIYAFQRVLEKHGYHICDCRPPNVRLVGNRLMIIDGRIDVIEEKEKKEAA